MFAVRNRAHLHDFSPLAAEVLLVGHSFTLTCKNRFFWVFLFDATRGAFSKVGLYPLTQNLVGFFSLLCYDGDCTAGVKISLRDKTQLPSHQNIMLPNYRGGPYRNHRHDLV